MPTIHLTCGLPASGKTSLARQLVAESAGRMRRVNLDDLRLMLDANDGRIRLGRDHEETVLAVQDAAVLAAIDGGFDVVVDNTHLVSRIPNRLKRVVAGRADFAVYDFTGVDVEECIGRDKVRERPVGEDVIRSMAERLKSTRDGWWKHPERLNDTPVPEPYVPDLSLPPAVLCDIDGTLAIHAGRGAYDLDLCETDLLNEEVARVLALCDRADGYIVLLSGRQSEFRKHTERWLAAHQVPYDELWMRAEGDRRSDDIVKAELFDAHVRGLYNVRFVLDDRARVVALWRRLGLKCWQVAYGNF
ncbi:putative phage polynucleotide kinase [Catenulispora acidiphila DSM 44928]|uniref:Putative phage polynucleotide kinase n=1 Tax=Catenulispora acidiphila (strain DSM 44928 / JCM 14897 / NBRC 102108 / NRRL B-24433 / ID139908) TaxID=479433 RepID=C7Q2Y9_CATAD|nr:AAA family ATPase [Catenulispora acidiphila]ACU71881.1 putative phage polynucleotide kinase [Catenulispora acidiphila DSM 44928]